MASHQWPGARVRHPRIDLLLEQAIACGEEPATSAMSAPNRNGCSGTPPWVARNIPIIAVKTMSETTRGFVRLTNRWNRNAVGCGMTALVMTAPAEPESRKGLDTGLHAAGSITDSDAGACVCAMLVRIVRMPTTRIVGVSVMRQTLRMAPYGVVSKTSGFSGNAVNQVAVVIDDRPFRGAMQTRPSVGVGRVECPRQRLPKSAVDPEEHTVSSGTALRGSKAAIFAPDNPQFRRALLVTSLTWSADNRLRIQSK